MALAKSPYDQYRQQSFNTATPEKLLIMLFDGALRFTAQAREYMEEKNHEQSHYYLLRVQDIVLELIGSLDMDVPISAPLYKMYDYIRYNLTEANIKKDTVYLDEAERNLKELRDTWVEAAKMIGKEKAVNSGRSIVRIEK